MKKGEMVMVVLTLAAYGLVAWFLWRMLEQCLNHTGYC